MIGLFYMNTVNALTFRQKFGKIIDQVVASGNPVVIERQNEPLVVLYPFEKKKEEIQKDEERLRREKASKMIDEWREKYGKKLKGVDTTALIRKFRDERYGEKFLRTGSNY